MKEEKGGRSKPYGQLTVLVVSFVLVVGARVLCRYCSVYYVVEHIHCMIISLNLIS